MNPIIPYYRPFGTPAQATITFLRSPVAGDKVTINGVDYIAGTHFFYNANPLDAVKALCAAINADFSGQEQHTLTNPVGPVWCAWYNKTLRLTATAPGASGNAITLTTNAPLTFSVSGATFTGGVNTSESGAYESVLTVTRPANATPFAAGDVVGNAATGILTFANIGPAGGSIFITDANLLVALAAIPAGMTSFRLHLYNAAPTDILDNAVWDLPSGDRTKYLGYVDLGVPIDVGSTLYVQTPQINKKVRLVTSSLFSFMVTNGAYTPTSGEVYFPELQTLSA